MFELVAKTQIPLLLLYVYKCTCYMYLGRYLLYVLVVSQSRAISIENQLEYKYQLKEVVDVFDYVKLQFIAVEEGFP